VLKSVYVNLLVLLLVVGNFACSTVGEVAKTGTLEALQHDLDIVRLNDLALLSGHIEKYRHLKGKFPFQGETNLPHYVLIATRTQQNQAFQGPPTAHKTTETKTFVNVLTSVLGDDIQIPFDLQRVAVNKPNFYIYMVIENIYYLAVHVHHDFPFANKVGPYYNKVEVTSSADAERSGVWLRSNLITNPDYIHAAGVAQIKPGYTDDLRLELGGNAAF